MDMDDILSNDVIQTNDTVVEDTSEDVSLEQNLAVMAEVESRSQEELLAQELSAMKGVSPESVGMIREPALLATVRIYESLGMPEPETLAINAVYESFDATLSDSEKKARVDAMRAEYEAWKATQ